MKPADVHNHLMEPGSLRVAPNATAVGGGESLQYPPAWDARAGESLFQQQQRCFAFTQGGRCPRKSHPELLESCSSWLKDPAHCFLPFVVDAVVFEQRVSLCSPGCLERPSSCFHLGCQSHSTLRVLTAALSTYLFHSKKTAFGNVCLYVNVDIQNKTVY